MRDHTPAGRRRLRVGSLFSGYVVLPATMKVCFERSSRPSGHRVADILRAGIHRCSSWPAHLRSPLDETSPETRSSSAQQLLVDVGMALDLGSHLHHIEGPYLRDQVVKRGPRERPGLEEHPDRVAVDRDWW